MFKRLLIRVDPRRSLVAATIWLVIALAASFALAASIWVGRVAREIVVQQHVRRLVLETDQLASDLGQAVTAREDALRAIARLVPPQDAYRQLKLAYPDMGWFALADPSGRIVAADRTDPDWAEPAPPAWITQGLHGPWLGVIDADVSGADPGMLGDLALPLLDPEGHTVAVVAAHLHWPALSGEIRRLSTAVDPGGSAQTLVLDGAGRVLIGPAELRGRRWSGVVQDEAAGPGNTQFERLPDGSSVLVARASVGAAAATGGPSWQLQLSEGRAFVYQRADALANRILWISIVLGVLSALAGALGARKLTNRLRRLARSAAAVGRNETSVIEVPSGHDEVAQLAAGFARILDDLRLERSELLKLSGDLERRVEARTREVERLAAESRYSAIVRERLKIARDLHDTLAHSMMAMLSEVRLLRKLQAHDPAALAEELGRAEEVAREGLNEARTAIAQMRVNAVRDTGLGSALAAAFERFVDRTGVAGDYAADPEAASFGDVRAETVFRMAEEVLRNVERHAHASRVSLGLQMVGATHLRLRIEDDGVGFDPSAAHAGHFGLVGLREQAQLIDADLRIDSAAGRGTTVSITVRIAPVMV